MSNKEIRNNFTVNQDELNKGIEKIVEIIRQKQFEKYGDTDISFSVGFLRD